MSKYLNTNTLLIFLTLQKIIPFYILSFIIPFYSNKFLIYSIILISAFIPIINIINTTNFKNILIYSSINQSRWLIIFIILKNLFWLIYLIIYSFIIFVIISFINYHKISFIRFYTKKFSINTNFFLICLFFNISGIPPFSFFLFKWFNIFLSLYNSDLYIILILLIISSFIILFIYIKISLYIIFFWNYNSKLIIKSRPSLSFQLLFIFFLVIFASIIIIIL